MQSRFEFVQKLICQTFNHNETLGRCAGLPGVAHAPADSMFDSFFEIGIFQHDESVAAAELHGRFFQLLASLRRHHRASGFTAGQRYGANAWVFNHLGDLVLGDKQVGVSTGWRTGIFHQGFKGQRALRHV